MRGPLRFGCNISAAECGVNERQHGDGVRAEDDDAIGFNDRVKIWRPRYDTPLP